MTLRFCSSIGRIHKTSAPKKFVEDSVLTDLFKMEGKDPITKFSVEHFQIRKSIQSNTFAGSVVPLCHRTAQPMLVATSGSDRICSNILPGHQKLDLALGTETINGNGTVAAQRRHLVTSGFSEMEATCNARPPKKFCLNKSEGPSAELLEVGNSTDRSDPYSTHISDISNICKEYK